MAKTPKTHEIKVVDNNIETIYADRILNIGLGSVVTRLTLANEVGSDAFAPKYNLIVPTSAMLDFLSFMNKMVDESPDVKEGLISTLDTLKKQIENM